MILNISYVHLESHYQYLVPKDRAQIMSIAVSFGKVKPLPIEYAGKTARVHNQKIFLFVPNNIRTRLMVKGEWPDPVLQVMGNG